MEKWRLFANVPADSPRIQAVIIEYLEEFTREWDWYAVDHDRYVGD